MSSAAGACDAMTRGGWGHPASMSIAGANKIEVSEEPTSGYPF